MIGLSPAVAPATDRSTALGVLRLVVAAFSTVAVQAFVVDQADLAVVRHLDLPLAVAAAVVIARPGGSTVVGLVFGLMVDAFGQRLFGLHCLAYAALGPVLRLVPPPSGRIRAGAVAWSAAFQAAAATVVIMIGQSLAAGGTAPHPVRRPVETALWAAIVAVPLVRWLPGESTLTGGRGFDGRARAVA